MPRRAPRRKSGDEPEIPLRELAYFNQNQIYWREHKSKRSFVCQVCGVDLRSITACIRHSGQQAHNSNLTVHNVRSVLLHLPAISNAHRQVLNESLQELLHDKHVKPEEVNRQLAFSRQLISALQARIPNCQINGIGSLWNSLLLPGTVVELDICRPDFTPEPTPQANGSDSQQPTATNESRVRPPGLGYVLEQVHDILAANVTYLPAPAPDAAPIQSTDPNELPSFPVYTKVTRCLAEGFHITILDDVGTTYRISSGTPMGHHLAKLIKSYMALDKRAWQLALLFIQFAKYAHINMPERGTFHPAVLPLLVIFYLQHTTPPILPNLHKLYKCHVTEHPPEAVYQVSHDDVNYSFICDPNHVAKYFPEPGEDNSCFDLADLWLGLLRFYLFDFQKATFAVSVTHSVPIYRKKDSAGMQTMVVLDPFAIQRNLCHNIIGNGFRYITAQMTAAYAYFGVPRLANGRHVFNKVRTADSPEPSVNTTDTATPTQSTEKSHSETPAKILHLTPVIDEADGFAENLIKMQSLLAQHFASLCCSGEQSLRQPRPDPFSSTNEQELSEVINFTTMLPRIIKVVLDDVIEPADILAITEYALRKNVRFLFGDYYQNELLFNQAQYQSLSRSLAKSFWKTLCSKYINRGHLAVKFSEFRQLFFSELRGVLKNWILNSRNTFSSTPNKSLKSPDTTVKPEAELPNSLSMDESSHERDELVDSMDACDTGLDSNHLEDSVDQIMNSVGDDSQGPDDLMNSTDDQPQENDDSLNACIVSPQKEKLIDSCITWNDVILSREDASPPIDDDRPGYYHSIVVNRLKPEDLSCPFRVLLNLPPPGEHGLRTSVLGLTSINGKSTMLAHTEDPEPKCRACGQLGHLQDSCTVAADQTVSFRSWQAVLNATPKQASPKQLSELTECLNRLASFHDCSYQNQWKQHLVDTFRRLFSARFSSVDVQLFGSCANGFELPCSDMDLCVLFPPNSPRWHELKTPTGMTKLIRQFESFLRANQNRLSVTHVRSIVSAKVPIVKVQFQNGCDVDISFSNYLAVHNTRMLKCYTLIEPQLRTLGIALKIIVKLNYIGNASVGGISSYAFVIMFIHYLQQKEHLPVLQELYEGLDKPIHIVSGWNAWFQDDLSVVRRLWKPPAVKMSLSEMWLGFFRYYLFEFDRDINVVCIRQKALLPRFVKMWDSLFAVEDPFNLDHNLAGGLCRDTLLCILDVFHAVLIHHTSFVRGDMPLGEWQYSLFSPDYLSPVRRLGPPASSQCFSCHQYGHRSSDCPLKRRKMRGQPDAAPNNDSSVDTLIGPFLLPPNSIQPRPMGLLSAPFQLPETFDDPSRWARGPPRNRPPFVQNRNPPGQNNARRSQFGRAQRTINPVPVRQNFERIPPGNNPVIHNYPNAETHRYNHHCPNDTPNHFHTGIVHAKEPPAGLMHPNQWEADFPVLSNDTSAVNQVWEMEFSRGAKFTHPAQGYTEFNQTYPTGDHHNIHTPAMMHAPPHNMTQRSHYYGPPAYDRRNRNAPRTRRHHHQLDSELAGQFGQMRTHDNGGVH